MMSLIIIVVMWGFFGWATHRVHVRARAAAEPGGTPDRRTDVGPGSGPVVQDVGPVVVPDTVPSEWVDSYRAENGG
jgi:hypothetical protein